MPHKDLEQRRLYLLHYKRRNRERYRDRDKAWAAANHANKRAAAAGVDGVLSIEDVLRLFADPTCHYCGKDNLAGRDLTIDHVVSLVRGGRNAADNLVVACLPCNISKYQQDRPRRWSRGFESCTECGTTKRKHICHGLCVTCYSRLRRRQRSAA